MSDPLFSVADQVVLVSGGSRGIGKAIAAGFARRDARVVITGRDEATLAAAAKEISTGAHAVEHVVCDVSKDDDLPRLADAVCSRCGRIDALINVAGVNNRKRAETYTAQEFDFILDINLRGLFLLTTEIGRRMISAKRGNIISIDSVNTYSPLKGVLPYAMSKAGVSMMTRGLALEWGPHNIRVNAIAPGFILTDLNRKLWSEETMQKWGFQNTPLGRLGGVEDLVGAALFLASPAAAFITGQVLYVDGGLSAGTNWPISLA